MPQNKPCMVTLRCRLSWFQMEQTLAARGLNGGGASYTPFWGESLPLLRAQSGLDLCNAEDKRNTRNTYQKTL